MTDTQKLTERLRALMDWDSPGWNVILRKSADALEAQQQQIAELESGREQASSFIGMNWACGHNGGSACVKCFRAACHERDENKVRAEKAEAEVAISINALRIAHELNASAEAERDHARLSANKLNRRIGELEHEKSAVARMAMRLSNSGDRHAGGKTAATVLAQELEKAETEVARLQAELKT